MPAAPLRVCYVLPADPGVAPGRAAVDRWPHNLQLLRALAATGEVEPVVIWRTSPGRRRSDTVIEVDAIPFHFVADGSRTGWRLARRVRSLRPDVVHANGLVYPLATLTLALLAGKARLRAATRLGGSALPRSTIRPKAGASLDGATRRSRLARPGSTAPSDGTTPPGSTARPGGSAQQRGRSTRLVVQHHGEQPQLSAARTIRLQRAVGRLADAYLFTGASEGQAEPWRAARVIHASTPCFEVLEAASDLRPLPRAEARARTGMSGEPAVLWVGRLTAGKDPLTAVAAFRDGVGRVSPAAELWLVASDRTLEPEVRAATAGDPRIHIVGPEPHDTMAAWYSAADLYLATSHHEGSGYALIEALTCGCTPVVSDLPSFRVIAGPLGRRFPAGNRAAAAAALADVVTLPRDEVTAWATDHLGWATVAAQLVAAYQGDPANCIRGEAMRDPR